MKRHTLFVLLGLCALATAQYYNEVWTSDVEVWPDGVNVIGIANTDGDPAPELVWYGSDIAREDDIYIWALDCVTGEAEEVWNDYVRIVATPGCAPRLLDVDSDGRSEIMVLVQDAPREPARWMLFGWTEGVGAGGDGSYRNLNRPSLEQNRPNPLNRKTLIHYSLPKPADVRLNVYDTSGRLVKTLASGPAEAGRHSVAWLCDDAEGKPLPEGPYYYTLQVDGRTISRKALVVK